MKFVVGVLESGDKDLVDSLFKYNPEAKQFPLVYADTYKGVIESAARYGDILLFVPSNYKCKRKIDFEAMKKYFAISNIVKINMVKINDINKDSFVIIHKEKIFSDVCTDADVPGFIRVDAVLSKRICNRKCFLLDRPAFKYQR